MMLNIDKQITYWIEGAKNDLDTAELLVSNDKILHSLFFCHLVIEKAIKACVVKATHEIPPKTHNLIYLTEKANLQLSNEYEIFIGVLMKYQLEGRYPEYQPEIPPIEVVKEYLIITKSLLKWLENQL